MDGSDKQGTAEEQHEQELKQTHAYVGRLYIEFIRCNEFIQQLQKILRDKEDNINELNARIQAKSQESSANEYPQENQTIFQTPEGQTFPVTNEHKKTVSLGAADS